MLTITATEAKTRLGQVFDAAHSAPVEISKNGVPFAFVLSAKQYWDLVGDTLSFDDKFYLVAGVANGEIEIAEAMSHLHLSSRHEFDELSKTFGIGLSDATMEKKNERRMRFFDAVQSGKEKQSDVFVFDEIVKQCKASAGVF